MENEPFAVFKESKAGNEIKFNQYWEQYDHFSEINVDSALFFAEKLNSLAILEKDQKWKAASFWSIAYLQNKKGQTDKAIYNYLQSAEIQKELGRFDNLANIYISLGDIFGKSKIYEEAFYYFDQAKDILHYEGTSHDKATLFRNIGFYQNLLNNFREAEEAVKVGISTASKSGDLENLSKLYNIWGAISANQREYENARSFYLLSIKFSDSLVHSEKAVAIASSNIGESYLLEGRRKEAKMWLDKALLLKKSIGDPVTTQYTFNLLAQLYIQEGNYELAISSLEEGLQEVEAASRNKSLDIVDNSISESLSLINHALLKMNEGAISSQLPRLNKMMSTYSGKLIAYNSRASSFQEELKTISQQQAVQAAVERYAFNEQLKASEATQRKMRYAFLIPVFLLIAALVTIYFVLRRNKHYKELYSKIEHVLNNSKALRHLK